MNQRNAIVLSQSTGNIVGSATAEDTALNLPLLVKLQDQITALHATVSNDSSYRKDTLTSLYELLTAVNE